MNIQNIVYNFFIVQRR